MMMIKTITTDTTTATITPTLKLSLLSDETELNVGDFETAMILELPYIVTIVVETVVSDEVNLLAAKPAVVAAIVLYIIDVYVVLTVSVVAIAGVSVPVILVISIIVDVAMLALTVAVVK